MGVSYTIVALIDPWIPALVLTGIKGHNVFIDHNGDAEGNFTLLAMKEHNGTLLLSPVGSFTQSSEPADTLVSNKV
jgi:hypothetical protein